MVREEDAREEEARENLMAEATALVERAELLPSGAAEPIVAGFRRDGSASLFFADDPVYQFNSRGHLRRAFVAGQIYKADAGRLVAITRNRQGGQLQLIGRSLPPAESAEFIATLQARLDNLTMEMEAGQVALLAEVPPGCGIVARLGNWLAALLGQIEIAKSPRAG